MNTSSEAILALKPVTFHYKSDQIAGLQKVSTQLELSKPAPQTVRNNQ